MFLNKIGSSEVASFEKTQNQNSAAVLSLWHCILSWFYMNCEQTEWEKIQAKESMMKVYSSMKLLRKIIQNVESKNDDVNTILDEYKFLVNQIDQKRWSAVIKSMMHELIEMLRVFKGNKDEFLKKWEEDELNDVKTMKLKQLTCLLTFWYWLAAWSNDSHDLKAAKDTYFYAVQLNAQKLNDVFFDPLSCTNEETTQKEFKFLTLCLVKLLRADPQHWIDVLDHFIDRMIHAGSLRAQVKNVWAEARLKRDELILKKSGKSKEEETKGNASDAHPSLSEPLVVHGLGYVLKNVARATPLSAIADKIPDAVSFVYDDVKKGDLKDIVDHIPNVVGEIAGSEAKYIAAAVVNGTEAVSKHVVDGVKDIGHVLGEGVHDFSQGVHNVFHSVKSFFSNLF